MYQTDKQIIQECDKLLTECIAWGMANYNKYSEETRRTIGITRFLYLKDKLLDHSPKYYRDKEKINKGIGTHQAIVRGEDENT